MSRRRAWAAGLALMALLATTDPTAARETSRPGRVANTEGENLRLRAAPTMTAPILKRLGPGWKVTVLGNPTADGRWLKIEHGGVIGYVAVGYVALEDHAVPPPPPRPTPPASPPASPPSSGARTGWVANTDGANLRLRSTASPSATIIKRLGPGWKVSVLSGPVTGSDGASWLKIEHGGTTGFAAAAYIASTEPVRQPTRPAPPAAPTQPAPGNRYLVASTARVRAEPRTSAGIMRNLWPGQIAELTGREVQAEGHRWLSVRSGSREGWMVASALGPRLSAETGRQLANEALTHVGRRYVWGGETPTGGFDCSGLVRYVVRKVTGVDATHVLAQQAEMGSPIDRDDLQVGDIVFFKNTYKPGLSHVGFYIGNGEFVNAQNERDGVVRASLDVPYWRDRWVGARRISD